MQVLEDKNMQIEKPQMREWGEKPVNIRKKSKFAKFAEYSMLLYLIPALSVFFMPNNILDQSKSCANFVKFMKIYFPNIEAFEKITSMPQVIAFYISFMWIWVILCSFLMIYYAFYLMPNSYDLKVFPKGIPTLIVLLLVGFISMECYYIGKMATHEISFGAKNFNIFFSSKLKMYFWISFFSL